MKKPLSKSQVKLIINLFQAEVIKVGKFRLRLGEKPPYNYAITPFLIDVRVLISYPSLLKRVAKEYIAVLNQLTFDRIVAIPLASLPIGAAIGLLTNKPWIYPRKEAKSYGTQKEIEGIFTEKEVVVIIDDTITSGATIMMAAEKLKANNLILNNVVLLVDRDEVGISLLRKKGLVVHAIFHINDILKILVDKNLISGKIYKSILVKHKLLKSDVVDKI